MNSFQESLREAPISSREDGRLMLSAIESVKSVIGARINQLQNDLTKAELKHALEKFSEDPKRGYGLLQTKLMGLATRIATEGSTTDQLQYQKMYSAFTKIIGPYLPTWREENEAALLVERNRALAASGNSARLSSTGSQRRQAQL